MDKGLSVFPPTLEKKTRYVADENTGKSRVHSFSRSSYTLISCHWE